MRRWRTSALVVLLFGVQSVLLVVGLMYGPEVLVTNFDRARLSGPEVVTAEDKARTSVIAAVASLAVVSSAGIGLLQLALGREKQATEQVSGALALLGSTSIHERTAAIYSLSRLSSDVSIENWPLALTLANMLSGSALDDPPVSTEPGKLARKRDEVQWLEIRRADLHAAIRALGTMEVSGTSTTSEFSLLLHYVDARRGLLEGLSFSGVSFAESDLSESVFRGSRFVSCEFRDCQLVASDFDRSRFVTCTFADCNLTGASFQGTVMKSVQFLNCSLDDTDFSGCRAKDLTLVGSTTEGAALPE